MIVIVSSAPSAATNIYFPIPLGMVNYTETGFMKIPAPKELKELLKNHWELNKGEQSVENWPKANIYTNHWAAETRMVSVEDNSLEGAGYHLKDKVWAAARDTIEKWTGMELQPTSLYGIRVYTEGAILVRPENALSTIRFVL